MSTLLFGLDLSGVTARLWNQSFNHNDPPPSFAASIGYPGVWDVRATSDDEQSIGFQNVPAGLVRVWFRKKGYVDQAFDTTMPDDGAKEIRLVKDSAVLSPLWLNGNQLMNNVGPIFLRGASLFTAFDKKLRGIDLGPVLRELQDYRCNCVRIWLMSKNVQANEFGWPALDPRVYGNTGYQLIGALRDELAGYGMYPYWGLFPDVGLLGLTLGEQQHHYDQAIDAIDSGLVEGQNEAAAYTGNQAHPQLSLATTPRVPWCWTSYSTSDPAYMSGTVPALDRGGTFGDLHPDRHYPAHILDCCPAKNVYFTSNKGLLIGEGDRYGWRGNLDTRQANLSANASRSGCMGFIAHTMRGERCENFDPDTANSATAIFHAFEAI